MKHLLFSSEGDQALATAMASRPLLAFDFDGTLAPIVARPGDARVSAAVARRLEALARRLTVAIISGRSVADLRERLAFQPHFVIGNHGAESPFATSDDAEAALDGFRLRLRDAADALTAAGVRVEDKQHSIALHYRTARDRERAQALLADIAGEPGAGLRSFGGKCVVNVVPAAAPDKAQALMALVAHCKAECAVFIGDDVNDEPVFAAAQPGWLTIRVGRDDPQTRARFCLDSVGEVGILLDRMLRLLEPAQR